MGEISDKNFRIQLLDICLPTFKKYGKMVAIQKEQDMGTNVFRIALVSPSPNNGQNISLIGG